MDRSRFNPISWHSPPTDREHMQCGKYFQVAFDCMSPKSHFRSFYAFGEVADCKQERKNLYSCMKLKLARNDTQEKIFKKNRAFVEAKEAIPVSHFWKERKDPIVAEFWPDPDKWREENKRNEEKKKTEI